MYECVSQTVGRVSEGHMLSFEHLQVDSISYLTLYLALTIVACALSWYSLHLCPLMISDAKYPFEFCQLSFFNCFFNCPFLLGGQFLLLRCMTLKYTYKSDKSLSDLCITNTYFSFYLALHLLMLLLKNTFLTLMKGILLHFYGLSYDNFY